MNEEMKPGNIEREDGVIYGTCPACGEDITLKDDPFRCHNCDHQLDWGTLYEEEKK